MVRRLISYLGVGDLVGRFSGGSSTCRFIPLVLILARPTFHLVALGDHGNGDAAEEEVYSAAADHVPRRTLADLSSSGWRRAPGAHFLGRGLRAQGHEVKLIPAQFVKPFVKSNKNDFIDLKRSLKLLLVSTCGSFRSRRTISWICKPCIVCANARWRGGLLLSTRFARSCSGAWL